MIKSITLSLSLFLLSLSSIASPKYSLENQVYAGASYDFNQDGFMDSVFLVRETSDAMMYSMVFMTGLSHGEKRVVSVNSNLLMAVDGKFRSIGEPVLEFIKFKNDDGTEYKPRSLKIGSEHWGVGRFKWSQVLTIAYRNGDFKLAGIDYQSIDTLSGDAQNCSLNLLTAKKDVIDADGNSLKKVGLNDTSMVNKQVSDLTEGKLYEVIRGECPVSKGFE